MRYNEQNSLVILHHDEVFATREEALNYVINEYEPKSLDAEPFVVKYGDTTKPNVILAFGTSSTGRGSFYAIDATKIEERIEEISHEQGEIEEIADNIYSIVSASGLTYDDNKIRNKITYEPNRRDIVIGDAESIAEAISLLSEYVQQNFSNTDFTLGESDAIKLLFVQQPNNKMSLVAEIKISKQGESDDLDFNNNIIGVKADGLYAASHLAYDDARNQLIFTTSGYKDGRYQDDAIVQRVDLGEHINVEGGQTDTIETVVNKNGNVATVKGNVKLGSTNSIVVRNGGLEANITVDVDALANNLIVTIGNQTITKQLPGIELFESAEYNDANEELIITFKTGNTLVIPIHGIIHTWNTLNSENSPIVLTKNVVTGGTDTLSGSIKLRSTDNLIGVENGKLYVSEQAVNDKVSTETSRATSAENAIQTQINSLQNSLNEETTRATAAETVNSTRIDELQESIGAGSAQTLADAKAYTDEQVLVEKTAREAKDVELEAALENKANASDVYTKTEIDNKGYLTQHQDISNLATIASVEAVETMAEDNATAIQELGAEVEDMKFVTNETDTVRMTMVKETGAETRVLSSDVKLKTISGENANIIKSDANGLYATVTFNYDKATNKITFNDGNGNKVFELNNFGILQDAFYDSESKSIVLVVKKDDETTERITIPVADLVNDWSVENNQNSPVVLQKTAGENGDVLSADISILNNENNLLVNNNGSLFVDGDCNSHKALWGNEVTNVQGVINILWGAYNDIEEIKQDIADLKEDNENIKDTLADLQEDLNNEKEQIDTNTSDIASLKERVENLENGLGDLTITVNNFDNRITEADNKAQQALDAIEGLGDISSIITRLNRIEEILEQLIDFGEYDIQL